MPTVIADANLSTRLASLTEPAEIVDETGRLLGRFTPPRPEPEPLVPWDPTITREELDRRANDPGGSTLAEFWQRMGRK